MHSISIHTYTKSYISHHTSMNAIYSNMITIAAISLDTYSHPNPAAKITKPTALPYTHINISYIVHII